MKEKRFADMDETEFRRIIDGYIDRAAEGEKDVPVDVFFDLLGERLTQSTQQTAVPLPADKAEQNPWLTTAGMFANDPMLELMLAEIYAARDAERPLDE